MSAEDKKIFEGVFVPCCEGAGYPFAMADCICGANERVLRGYIREDPNLPPMTQAQRDWCLDEIGSVEGYERKDYEHYSNADLGSAVLHAWTDYCRDKGLL
jgi:hypothetical protein